MKNVESNMWQEAKHKLHLCRVVEASKLNNIICSLVLPSYYRNKIEVKIIKSNLMKFMCLAKHFAEG